MTSTTVYRQNVYCTDNNTSEIFVHDSWNPTLFTECPGNIPYHTFDLAVKIGSVSNQVVVPKVNLEGTNKRFNCQGGEFNISAGPDSSYNLVGSLTFSRNSRINMVNFLLNSDNDGDYLNCEMFLPSNLSGNLTQAVSSGNVIDVPVTALTIAKVGQQVVLTEGATTQNLGDIVSIDITNSQLTVTNTITNSFTTSAQITIEDLFIRDIKLYNGSQYKIGSSVGALMAIPAGTTLEVYYKNVGSTSKTFNYYIEYFD